MNVTMAQMEALRAALVRHHSMFSLAELEEDTDALVTAAREFDIDPQGGEEWLEWVDGFASGHALAELEIYRERLLRVMMHQSRKAAEQ